VYSNQSYVNNRVGHINKGCVFILELMYNQCDIHDTPVLM